MRFPIRPARGWTSRKQKKHFGKKNECLRIGGKREGRSRGTLNPTRYSCSETMRRCINGGKCGLRPPHRSLNVQKSPPRSEINEPSKKGGQKNDDEPKRRPIGSLGVGSCLSILQEKASSRRDQQRRGRGGGS